MKKFIILISLAASFFCVSCKKEEQAPVVEPGPEIISEIVQTPLSKVAQERVKSCVAISSSKGLGSGVVVYEDEKNFYIATSYHVVKDCEVIQVVLDNKKGYKSNLVIYDEEYDIAIISSKKIKANSNLKSLQITNEITSVSLLNEVFTIGTPFSLEYYNTVTSGVVAKLDDNNKYFYHDAYINDGNSGGAIFLSDGRFVGINCTKISSKSGGILAKGVSSYCIYALLCEAGVLS